MIARKGGAIWALALTPIVLLPPLLAIMICLRQRSVARESGQEPVDHTWILVAAVLNIVLSILFWRWVAQSTLSAGLLLDLFIRRPSGPSSGGSI